MRRRLLHHKKVVEPVPTFWGYEIVIDEFYYPGAGPHDTALFPIYRYHYRPIYNDRSIGDDVYITQNDENPDFINMEFSIDASSATDVANTGTEINGSNGNLSFNTWEDTQTMDSYRLLATVNMRVWYVASNGAIRGEDTSSTNAEQAAIQIRWHTPVVTLFYDDAPAQPEEEGREIILKPIVKWTQEGYDDDGKIYIETSDTVDKAQYIFYFTGDISVDADGNVTVPSSTVENRHKVGTVTVMVTSEHVVDGEEQSGSDTCDIYQEAYEEPQHLEDTTFPMDILMLNNETHKQEIFDRTGYSYNDYPKEKYTPLGIILTPNPIHSSESGYGSGWKGVIALMDASLSSPETGDSSPSEILCGSSECYSERMHTVDEGSYINDFPSLLPYADNNGAPADHIVGVIDDIDGYPDYNNNVVSAATDKSSAIMSTTDAFAGYANESGHKAMSPYTISEDYRNEHSDIYNIYGYNEGAYDRCEGYGDRVISALSDYNGQFNSLAILLGKSWTKGREWIENSTSNSNNLQTDCPAVEACWKYAPEGTSQGGWYLPGLGELSLMAARFNKINETLYLINEYYGVDVSPLEDTSVPYLSSTHFISSMYDDNADTEVESSTLYALFPNISGDAGYNRVCTTILSGTARSGGYVRPFKKIKNVDAGYELMPAHYTQTFCDGDSDREWFGQKFIVSFRRACMAKINSDNSDYMDGSCLRIYGYKVKGENDTTKVSDTPRLLAETYVEGAVSESLVLSNSDHWPQVSDGQGNYVYEGDEMGVNIIGRFSTGYQFDKNGASNGRNGGYVDMDTDEFDRDGTVEPGWYVLAGIGVTARLLSSTASEETIISTSFYKTITKREIDIVNGVENKEVFFDNVRHSTLSNLTEKTDAPFYVGQFDRPVAILLGSETPSEGD